MRQFTDEEIDRYMKHGYEITGNDEDILGRCFICGRPLNEVELPEGPEKKVVCVEDRDFFVESFEELEEMEEI